LHCLLLLVLLARPALAQDSTSQQLYSTDRLRILIAEAAANNALIPSALHAYRARVETEMALIIIDSAGRERTGQIEQIASDVRWRPADRYDQRVVGYRSQAVGPMFSLMSVFGGWTTPTLYGNQLQLGVTPTETAERMPAGATRTLLSVHPLASSRDSFYTFSSGDTAVVLYSRGRRIPVVRVRVTPRIDAKGDAILFFGDMYLDADRKQIVRMRGRMVELKNGKVTLKSGSKIPGVSGASFVEVENVEVDGQFWLPTYQRTEIQARLALLGDFRAIVRIVSRFRDFRINDSTWSARSTGSLSFAPSDSMTRFRDWNRALGAATTDAQYADFDDVAPGSWTTVGSTGLQFRPRTIGDVLRFNRIEGLFTGLSAERDFRDASPGTSLRGSLGWAWAEKTSRGMLTLQHASSRSATGIRIERSLLSTNDFQPPLSGGATTPALLGSVDDFDYLDRRGITLFATRKLGVQRRSLLRLEVGRGSDRAVEQHASRGLYVQGDGFRPNRGITPGNFVRSLAALEINPQVSGQFIDRGVGATIQYERGDGELRWQRLELRTAARHELGPLQVYARGNAGTLIGAPIPQAMFEIGSSEGLTGYSYKQFGGDRAATMDGVVGYTFPFLRAPMHLPEQLIAPGIAPGVAFGIHGAWAEASDAAARRALEILGTTTDKSGAIGPLSRPTEGVRASIEALATFFSGSLAIGVARPIDRAGAWKLTGRIGLGF
jgi:hypothetical protein